MDFFTTAKKRYSHRLGYQNKAVPRETLNKIAQTAILAPTGCNSQTTEFVIIDQPQLVESIIKIIGKPFLTDCPAFIACIVDKEAKQTYFDMHFQLEDCAAATQNLLLAATASGLASLWIDGYLRTENKAEDIASLIQLPSDKKIQVILPMGYPLTEGSQPAKKPVAQRVFLNHYGNN